MEFQNPAQCLVGSTLIPIRCTQNQKHKRFFTGDKQTIKLSLLYLSARIAKNRLIYFCFFFFNNIIIHCTF